MRRLALFLLTACLTFQVPPVACQSNNTDSKFKEVKIPAGTAVDVELVYYVSSDSIQKGDVISFRAVEPVKIDGTTVVHARALCTAVVVKAKRRRRWGRSGEITFRMRDIIAVDDQRIPLEFGRAVQGEGKKAEVASGIAATGVLLWPIAPVALLWGLKKGEDAFIPAGKRFEVITKAEVIVRVPVE